MVIRSYLLIQQYTEAMMALTACPALRDHVTPQTLAMVEGVMSSAGRGGRGHMLLVRVPSLQLARLARERLEEAQNKLGLERRFAVLLGGPTNEISLAPHFCTQLRVCNTNSLNIFARCSVLLSLLLSANKIAPFRIFDK